MEAQEHAIIRRRHAGAIAMISANEAASAESAAGRASPAAAVDAALEQLRNAVRVQLGVERPPPPLDLDPEHLVRFSSDLPETLDPDERAALASRAEALAPWLQGPFLLGGDLVVGGAWRSDRRWEDLDPEVGDSLAGRRVLDVGSNAGYDAFMFKQRGADEVVACEPHAFHQQALFLESLYRTGVCFEQIGWQQLDVARLGTFDLIHCHGVLYHEAHPVAMLQALRPLLRDGGVLLLGTMMLADPEMSEHLRFVPGSFAGDPTWWMVPGRLAVRWLLEAAGFAVVYEFGVRPGLRGEFQVLSGYLRCGTGTPAPMLTSAGR